MKKKCQQKTAGIGILIGARPASPGPAQPPG